MSLMSQYFFQLREEFDQGWEVQMDEENSIHDVAALLKEFFRDLPDPLLTRDLYMAFINTTCKQHTVKHTHKFKINHHLVTLPAVFEFNLVTARLFFFSFFFFYSFGPFRPGACPSAARLFTSSM